MHLEIFGLIKMKNRDWKSRTLKKIIEIWEVNVWILEVVQEMVCQNVLLKLAYLKVNCHHP